MASRRVVLCAAGAAALAACAPLPRAENGERIVVRRGALAPEVARGRLLAAMRECDYVLLGELHDNVHHHRRRGALIEALAPAIVVAEYLPRGARVDFSAGVLNGLQAAGYDARGWSWPAHEPLFEAVARSGAALEGGNVARELARRVAREGASAQPAELRAVLAPLNTTAHDALAEDLVRGHCGHLSGARLESMLQAQRVRDASLALALRGARARAARRPVVLIAGNGHVRRDYGVPQVLAVADAGATTLAVGFVEHDDADAEAVYDALWITPAAPRTDPCAGFKLPARG